MSYVPSIVIDSVIEAFGAFIQPFVGNAQIVRAHVNRVPPPPTPFVKLNEILLADLEVPATYNDGVNQIGSIVSPTRIHIQADFYGQQAGDWCKAVKGVYRTTYATLQFPSNIQPLYCDDGMMSPLVTGEEQYLNRWTMTMVAQYNPILTVPLQSADQLAASLYEVD